MTTTKELALLSSGFLSKKLSKKQLGKKINITAKICWTLPLLSLFLPISAHAQTSLLGVIKSQENQAQWDGIKRRLAVSGIPYCVIDLAQVKQSADLNGSSVLLLPNLQTLNTTHVRALQNWMDKGGKVIATGPIGTLSVPSVRTGLRSLLGGYWSVSFTNSSSLETTLINSQPWLRQPGLIGNTRGGVIIPSGIKTQTVAVWKSQENPPAVVATDKSIFLGWRWGLDPVSSPDLDSAWLKAAVSRYSSVPNNSRQPTAANTEKSCLNSPAQVITTQARVTAPVFTGWSEVPASTYTDRSKIPTPAISNSPTIQRPNPNLAVNSLPFNQPNQVIPQSPNPVPPPALAPTRQISESQAIAMRDELENLLGRFESALLAANATSTQLEVAKKNITTGANSSLSSSIKALAEARTGLKKFQQLLAQNDYNAALENWLQARRTLWDNYPLNQKIAQPEVRAIWLDRGSIVNAKSESGLVKIFDNLAAAGINTVFFETVNAGYTLYPSQVAPEQNPMLRGWDPLASAVKLAHQRGMELHAWVWIFAAGNRNHNVILKQPTDYLGPVITAHPDWANYDHRGRVSELSSGKVFLDPANPEVRNYLLNLLEEIATRYQVDGIQLDYIRYPFQDNNQIYGYGSASLQQFQQQTGIDPRQVSPSQPALWRKWTEFRTAQIDSFVANVAQRLRVKRPEIILSAAVFPIPRSERIQKIQQNWEDWASRGDLDLVVLMSYAPDTIQFKQIAQPLLTQASFGASLILPGIRLLNLPEVVAVDQIQLLRDLPAGGYSLFAVENLTDNLSAIFNRTQGSWSSKATEPVPYRQPFRAAVSRYSALEQEWSFLVANKQIAIPDFQLKEWSNRRAELKKALNQLATQPSNKNLLVAQAALVSFRFQFPKWLQDYSTQQPYQVQVWENRLATLDKLLRYGERILSNQKLPPVAER